MTLDGNNNLVLPGNLIDLINPHEVRGGFDFFAVGIASDGLVATINPSNVEGGAFSLNNAQVDSAPVVEGVPEASSLVVWAILAVLGLVGYRSQVRRAS